MLRHVLELAEKRYDEALGAYETRRDAYMEARHVATATDYEICKNAYTEAQAIYMQAASELRDLQEINRLSVHRAHFDTEFI